MSNTEEKLGFYNNKLYRYYPLPQYGDGIAKIELIMTKEAFIACYNKWILEKEEKSE